MTITEMIYKLFKNYLNHFFEDTILERVVFDGGMYFGREPFIK